MWTETFNDVWLKEIKARAKQGDTRAKHIVSFIERYGLNVYVETFPHNG